MLAVAQLLVLLVASPALAGAHAAESASGEISASLAEEHTYFVGESGAWVHNACLGELRRAVRMLDEGGYSSRAIRRQIIEGATGNATFDRLNGASIARTREFANRYAANVTLVGSRVNPMKALRPDSDFDYLITGVSKLRNRAGRLLPRGRGGGELTGRGWSGQDFLDGPIGDRPSITFFPFE